VRVLLVGSGGREHALAWKLAQSPTLAALHAAPGNPGIAALGDCHPVPADDLQELVRLARRLSADLVAVGPEAPLVAGLADELRTAGIPVFGPSRAAARIEGSKRFAKEVMAAAAVPTAAVLREPTPPCVVKHDGLAAGKGVFVCRDDDELAAGLAAASALGGEFFAEELLDGVELSVFAVCDGREALPLPASRDFKRLLDGDRGPNTGGMGSFSPVPGISADDVGQIVDSVYRPVLRELERRGAPFVGLLYAGLMLTDDGPRVLEFNCRFGDPETQSVLPRVDGDLVQVLAAAARSELAGHRVSESAASAVTIVLVGHHPLDRGDHGTPIAGVADAEAAGALVFHAGTRVEDGRLVTAGRRILNVTGLDDSLPDARRRAYEAAGRIRYTGAHFRTDIAGEVAAARA
jgi:phosphoribosylamine--glycine ligase